MEPLTNGAPTRSYIHMAMYGNGPFSVSQIWSLKSCGDSRLDLAASEGDFRIAEQTRYEHWHMP